MLKNNNQLAVKRIAKRSMKSNRIRNIFSIAAVILTTLMLTSVFTIMISLGKNMNIMQLRQQGTCASVLLNHPTAEQTEIAKKADAVKAVGIRITLGTIAIEGTEDNPVTLSYFDTPEFEKNYVPAIGTVHGTYPSESDEIMLSLSSLKALGITAPVVSTSIPLTIQTTDGKVNEENFTLSGWYQDFGGFSSSGDALVSKQYTESKGMTAEKDGILSISCEANQQGPVYDALEQTLDSEQEIQTTGDVQNEAGLTMMMITGIIVLISGIIVLSGYLLINNVLYISVTKDIRFYGMLKTIGTSPSQIRKIVRSQALHFLVIGVPVGVLLGTLISFVAAPLAMRVLSSGSRIESGILPTDMTFHPFIYLGTIFFAILTVVLSCRKPAKIASTVSPVEALKYNGMIGGGKSKPKKAAHGGKPHQMAFRNVFREKKRAIRVFASLFTGTLAFLSVNTFIGALSFDNYIDAYLPNDYAIYTYNSDETSDEDYKASIQRLVEKMQEIKGLEYVEACHATTVNLELDTELYKPFIDYFASINSPENANQQLEQCENGETPFATTVFSVSTRMLERYNQKAHTKIDIDAFQKGEVALVGELETDADGESLLGKTIQLTDTKSGKQISLQIGSVSSSESNYGLNLGYYYSSIAPSYILVCEDVLNELNGDPTTPMILADCKNESYVDTCDQLVQGLLDNNQYVEAYDIKKSEIASFHSSMLALNVLSSGISIILILIGVLNFINVMLTGVYTRRRELAVLESVGMTKKQVRKMLMCEGIYYAVITIALILTLGNGIIYLIGYLSQQTADYAVFYYPTLLILLIILFILAVCILVPSLVYRIASRESITERLRDTD